MVRFYGSQPNNSNRGTLARGFPCCFDIDVNYVPSKEHLVESDLTRILSSSQNMIKFTKSRSNSGTTPKATKTGFAHTSKTLN